MQHAYCMTDAGPPAEAQSVKNSCSSDKGLNGQTASQQHQMFRGRVQEQGLHSGAFSYMPSQIPNVCMLVLTEAEAPSVCLTVPLQM